MKPYLFVDFYKTLSFGKFWHLVPLSLQKQIHELVFADSLQSPLADKWMRGKVTSEEVNQLVSKELNVNYEELWDLFVQSSEAIGVSKEALTLIEQLQSKYTTVLMTDNMDALNRFTVPAYTLDTVFNIIINSANVGIRKSDGDGEIFKLVTKDFTGSILIDDREHICSVFTALGGRALRVTEKDNTEKHLQSLLNSF